LLTNAFTCSNIQISLGDIMCHQIFIIFKAHFQNFTISVTGLRIYLPHSFVIKYKSTPKKAHHRTASIGLSTLNPPSHRLTQLSFIIKKGHTRGIKSGAFFCNHSKNQSLSFADNHITQIYGKLPNNHLINSGDCFTKEFNLDIFSG
jgi:hypothetical protein